MAKKKINPDENEKPRVHKELEGFDIQINSFGEITTSFDIDKINQFLNKTVDDKKLRHRTDLNLKGDPEPDDQTDKESDDELNLDDEDIDMDETPKKAPKRR
ncbi:hypothetical protein [Spirosoma sp. KUDC1026]|uniref:hypothetical protein n=1 Tax=Spirosoma sp. KUDC1026 TaxID=2745947 RepID=UPI00159BD572|nr:hypothetical protein [Spirosoma sp. KUDC1026]QKZ15552.1 hypothetical protein HU175_24210 [Spirosoma sp. KUDC1026]